LGEAVPPPGSAAYAEETPSREVTPTTETTLRP